MNRYFVQWTFCMGLTLIVSFSGWTAQDELVTSTINGLEISLDSETGGLRKLANQATGEILQADREKAGLIDMAYPVEEFLPLRLSVRFSKARIEKKENSVSIVWDRLGPSRTSHATLPAGHISARVELRAATDGRSVVLTCRVDNQSSGTIPQILFPDFVGLRPFEGRERTILQFANGRVIPFTEPLESKDWRTEVWFNGVPFWPNTGWNKYEANIAGLYYKHAMRWLDFGSYRGGLSIFEKRWGGKLIPTIYTHRTEAEPDSMRLAWEQRVTVAPGKTWTSDEYWLTPHPGGWAKGIEVFREYIYQVNPPRALPRRVRDGIGCKSVMMSIFPENHPDKVPLRFEDLPEVARDAKEHGIEEVVPWFWCHYFEMPIRVKEELGTTEDFLDAFRKCKDLGVTIAPFVDVKIVRKPQAERYGMPESARGFQGSQLIVHQELVPHTDPYYLTKEFIEAAPAGYPKPLWDIYNVFPDADDYRYNVKNDLWLQEVPVAFKEWIDRGVTSYSWDLCRSATVPGGQKSKVVTACERIRELARKVDPESSFSGESAGNVEYESHVLDYTWIWSRTLDGGPVMNVLRTPRESYNIDEDPMDVKKGFAAGMFLNLMPRRPDGYNGTALIKEKPELSKALKLVVERRKQFLSFFTEGFALGDSMLTQPAEGFVRGYQNVDRMLVIVLNDRQTAQTVELKSDLALWLPTSKSWSENRFNAQGELKSKREGDGPNWTASTPSLEPGEMAFYEIAVQ